MKLPSLFEFRKLHIYILTFIFRPLFIPLCLYVFLTAPLYWNGKVVLAKPFGVADFLMQTPFRVPITIIGAPITMLIGELGYTYS
jgi:hypothetical protein